MTSGGTVAAVTAGSLPVYAGPVRSVPRLPAPGRCLVMGVVNVTPDSFSDGGRWLERGSAIDHARSLVAAGADIVDIGGESTRPGAERPTLATEVARVLPVVAALAEAGVLVSVDTMRADVARQCVEAGASLVNDVSGGLADPAMLATVADLGVPYVVMHWRGHSASMQQQASYDDVVAEVTAELASRVEAARAAGIDDDRLVLDPGIGFAKEADHNWTLLRHLDRLHALGLPVLVGSSRKSFLGRLLAAPDGTARAADERDAASAALTTLAALGGVWCVRVHEVAASADAVRVAARIGAVAP